MRQFTECELTERKAPEELHKLNHSPRTSSHSPLTHNILANHETYRAEFQMEIEDLIQHLNFRHLIN